MNRPTVTVVIPTYNAAQHLRDTLECVLAQSASGLEVLLVDDGSTDSTLELARSYGSRLRIFEQRHAGPGAARNVGILAARAPLIAFCDADDLWHLDKLARQQAALAERPDAIMCHTDFSLSDAPRANRVSRLAEFSKYDPLDPFYSLLRGNFVATSSVLVRRDALTRAGMFDGTLHGSEDLKLWLRLAQLGSIVAVPEVLTFMREHPGRTTRTLRYHRDQLRATRFMLARWADDRKAVELLNHRLRRVLWDLAYVEKQHGNLAAARACYWRCVALGEQRLASLLRAVALSVIPSWTLRRGVASEPPMVASVQ